MAIILWLLGIGVAALGLFAGGELMHATHSGAIALWENTLTRGQFIGDVAALVAGILIIAFGTVLEQLHHLRRTTHHISVMLSHMAHDANVAAEARIRQGPPLPPMPPATPALLPVVPPRTVP